MPILVDGNNLMHRLPRGERSRDGVRRLLLQQTRRERISVTVVFDGAPPRSGPATEHLGAITIRYSGVRSADTAILESLPDTSARNWTVVTDDRTLADRARRRGARIRRLDEWLGRRGRPKSPPRRPHEPPLAALEVRRWEEEFAQRPTDDDERPGIVLAKRRRKG